MQKDYYELLSVNRNASEAEIKKAYRRLAMKYHPDRNPNDQTTEEKFKEVQKAYAVLSDQQKRAAYDRFGHAGVDASVGAGNHAGFGDIFEDIFENIFSGGRRQTRQHGGADLQLTVELTLEEAALGKEIEVAIPRHGICGICQGSGAKKGTKPQNCETCNGMGQVRIQQGFFSIQQTCPTCRGEGKVARDPCTNCQGQGRVRESKKLTIKIPAGVDSGDRIRLSGEGEAGAYGGKAGDLFVQVSIKKHAIFTRNENDLHCEVPISFTIAAIGGTIEVPTLEGRVTLKIPGETQTGKTFRLRGKGMKSVRSHSVGDLLCSVVIETPVNLSREQKELFTKLQTSIDGSKEQHSPKTNFWFAGVKKFFEDMKF